MAVYTAEIQKLYVAYFNRPADYEGLIHWEKVLVANNGNVQAVSRFFAESAEYRDQNVGKTNLQIVNQIYNNLFNRDADTTGLLFWAARLSEGTFTVDQIVKVIADNASDTDAKDKTTYANKVAAATAFTAEVNTASEIIGYSGPAANAAAKIWLSTIGTAESLAAATQPAALQATVTSVAQTGTQAGGQTSTLTKGLDNFTGTAGSDTFVASIDDTNAELNTLSSIDIINGGTGTDFLKVQHAGGAITLGNLSNVEIVQIDSAASNGVEVDSRNTSGITELSVLKSAGSVAITAGTATDISLAARELADGQNHYINGGKNVTVTATEMGASSIPAFVPVSEADTITVGEQIAATGNVVVNVAGKAYDAAVGNIEMGAIKVYGGATITVNQTATTSSTAAASDDSASTVMQGSIDIATNAATTTVNVKQTANVAAVNGVAGATAGGVNEVASVKFGALTKGDSITMNGLTFKAAVDMTGAEVAAAFSNLVKNNLPVVGDTQSSGAHAKGGYTGVFNTAVWTSGAATGDTVVFSAVTKNSNVTDLNSTAAVAPALPMYTFTNTSTTSTAPTFTITQGLSTSTAGAVTGGVAGVTAGAVNIDASNAAALKTVTVDGYTAMGSGMTGSSSTKLETLNLLNGGSFSVGAAAETFALNLTKVGATGTGMAAGLDLNNAATKVLNVTTNGANWANLDLNDAAATTTLNVSGNGLLTATGSDLKAVTTVKVSGTAGLDLGAGVRGTVTSVDTTGTTGATTIAINGTSTYTGGAGVDKVTVADATTAMGKAINLGAGDDMLTITNAGTIALPTATISGGEGRDTIVMSAANAVALSANGDFGGKIDGFEVLSVSNATATGTINLANLDNINYVISANSTAVAGTATRATFSVTVANGANNGDVVTFGGNTLYTANGTLTAAQLAQQLAGLNYAGYTVTSFNGTTLTFASTGTGAGAVAPTTATNPFGFTDADAAVGTPATFTIGSPVNGADAAAAAAALTISNLTSGGTLELGNGSKDAAGAIVGIKDAATGTADVLNIVTKGMMLGTVTANNVETINVAADTASSLTVKGNASLGTINVTGSKMLTLSLDAADTNVAVVNAGASTGGLILDLRAHNGVAVTVTGSTIGDTLHASAGVNGKADVLNGGAGDDILMTGSNGARLTGGAGNDLFVLQGGNKEANTYSIITDMQAGDLLKLNQNDGTVVTSFAKLTATLNETTLVFSNYVDAAALQAANGQAVWFSFGGNSYVMIDNGANSTSFENGVDSIVQIAGVASLDGTSWNGTYGTIGLV